MVPWQASQVSVVGMCVGVLPVAVVPLWHPEQPLTMPVWLKLALKFEVFNVANTWAATSNSSYQAFQEKGMVISPTPLYGQASADGGFPDGTQARRMQVSARFTF